MNGFVIKTIIRFIIFFFYACIAWRVVTYYHPILTITDELIELIFVFLSVNFVAWALDSFTPFDGSPWPIDWTRWG